MKHHKLHEIAKFAAGLVAADFITVWWAYATGLLPVDFIGVTFTPEMAIPKLVFDAAVILFLIHYGWNIGKMPAPRERSYLIVAGVIFTVIATLHLLRLFSGFEIVLGGWTAPLWLSWLGIIITAYLAYTSFHFAMRTARR